MMPYCLHQFKIEKQEEPLIRMKTLRVWNCIGNCNYYSKYQSNIHFVNEYPLYPKQKLKIQNYK